MAKLLKQKQPNLFEFAFALRQKKQVASYLDVTSYKPVFHVSSKLNWQHGYASLMMPLCVHPTNPNGIVCYDLMHDPEEILEASASEIQQRIFASNEELAKLSKARFHVKTIHINKSPMIAPLNVLDERHSW